MASLTIRPTKGGSAFSLDVDLSVEAALLITTIQAISSHTNFKLVYRGTVIKPALTLAAQGLKSGSVLVLIPEVKEKVKNAEEELINQLTQLGYSEKLSRAAAIQVGTSIGCVERAIDWLNDNKERLERIEAVTTAPSYTISQLKPQRTTIEYVQEEDLSGPEKILLNESEISLVYCWGSGSSGQLGSGNTRNELVPRIVGSLSGKEIVQVSCGVQHSIALTRDGKIYQWGKFLYRSNKMYDDDKFRECRLPMALETICEFSSITAGGAHNLATDLAGQVYSWGEGLHGQLGHGSKQNEMLPKLVNELKGVKVVMISAGSMHSVVLCATGDVIVWGKNNRGQLGLKQLRESDTPQLLRIGDPALNMDWQSPKAKMISCGPWQTLVVVEGSPSLHSFGNDRLPIVRSQLDFEEIKAACCDLESSYLLTQRGDLYEWNTESINKVVVERPIRSIFSGSSYLVLLLEDGCLMVKGDNSRGQLGIGSLQSTKTLTIIRGLTGVPVASVACGASHTLALVLHENLQQNLLSLQDHDWADVTLTSSEGLTLPCYSVISSETLAHFPHTPDKAYRLQLSYQALCLFRQYAYSGLIISNEIPLIEELHRLSVDFGLKDLEEAARTKLRDAKIESSLSTPEALSEQNRQLFELRKKVFGLSLSLQRESLRTQAIQAADQEIAAAPPQDPIVVEIPVEEPDDREERRRRLIAAAERRARGED